jgi:hypothetical protein
MALTKLLRRLLRIPLIVFRKTLNVLTITARPWQPDVLPVGGLSVERLSALLFALRQVSADEQVPFLLLWYSIELMEIHWLII